MHGMPFFIFDNWKALIDVFSYYKFLEDNEVILLYKGPVNSEVLSSILNLAEGRLNELKERSVIKKRVFNILVECIQNTFLHLEPLEIVKGEDFTAILVLANSGNAYNIITGNYLRTPNALRLKENLDDLSSLDEKNLNLKHQMVLTEQGFSEKGGAGLGLIEMFQKSNGEVFYDFDNLDDKYTFYSLQVNIKK